MDLTRITRLRAGALTSRGDRASFEKVQSLPQTITSSLYLHAWRDNFLQDFRNSEKNAIEEECLELGDERTA